MASLSDNAQIIHQLRSNEIIQNWKAGKEAWCCAWSDDGSYFAWSKGQRQLVLVPWNVDKNCPLNINNTDKNNVIIRRKPAVTVDAGDLIWSLAFGSNKTEGLVLAIGLQSGRIRIWKVETATAFLDLVDHTNIVRSLCFAPDGSMRLLSCGRDCLLKFWQVNDYGNMFKTIKVRGPSWLYSCAWSPDATAIAVTGKSRFAELFDGRTYNRIARLEGHHHDVVSSHFSPDSQFLATASYDSTLIIWHVRSATKLRDFGHLFPTPSAIYAAGENGAFVRGVSYSQDGVHVASVADDGFVRFWNIESDTDLPQSVAGITHTLCCSFSPNGRVLAVGDRNGTVSFIESPVQIPALQHLCRCTILKYTAVENIVKLPLPFRLMNYLNFVVATPA